MNYIARLQTDLAAAQAALTANVEMTQEFRVHLGGSKSRASIPAAADATGSRRAPRRAK